MALDLTVLTDSIVLTGVISALLSVAVALVSVSVVALATKYVLQSLRHDRQDYSDISDEDCKRWFATDSQEDKDANGITRWEDYKNL